MERFKVFTAGIDVTSASVILGVLVGILPPIATLLAIIWYIIMICQSRTARNLRRDFRQLRIYRLRIKLKLLEEEHRRSLATPIQRDDDGEDE